MNRQMSHQNTIVPKYFGEGAEISKLSGKILDPGEKKFSIIDDSIGEVTYKDFTSKMGDEKYGLDEGFILQYLSAYFNSDGESKVSSTVLNIVYNSISEHLELVYRLKQKFSNKILIYTGNEAKLRLMAAGIKAGDENSMGMVGLSKVA